MTAGVITGRILGEQLEDGVPEGAQTATTE
jgi:hypothetical protein